jgi:hypothetical protein
MAEKCQAEKSGKQSHAGCKKTWSARVPAGIAKNNCKKGVSSKKCNLAPTGLFIVAQGNALGKIKHMY